MTSRSDRPSPGTEPQTEAGRRLLDGVTWPGADPIPGQTCSLCGRVPPSPHGVACPLVRSEPGAEGLTQEQRDYADKTIEYWVRRAHDAENQVRIRDAATPAADSRGLDVAWEAAETVLPEGWTLELGDWRAEPNRPEGIAPFEAVAQPYVRQHDGNDRMVIGRGTSAVAALDDLTSALTDPDPAP